MVHDIEMVLPGRIQLVEDQAALHPFHFRAEAGVVGVPEEVAGLVHRDAREQGLVDFKTDGDIAGRKELYERQLQWYAYALAKLTGMEARGVLLGV